MLFYNDCINACLLNIVIVVLRSVVYLFVLYVVFVVCCCCVCMRVRVCYAFVSNEFLMFAHVCFFYALLFVCIMSLFVCVFLCVVNV